MKNIVWFLLLLCTACSHQVKNESLEKINVLLSSKKAVLPISDFASSVECIPLAAKDSVVIDELVRVIIKDDFIYAADNASLYKFTETGNLISSICHRGNSPSEYINISDFQIDKDGCVWMLSRNNKTLYKYAWNGDLEKKILLGHWIEKIYLLDKGKMLLYAGNEKSKSFEHTLYVLDLETGTMTNKSLMINDNKSTYLHVKSLNHFSCNGEQNYFYQMFNDTIFYINEKGMPVPKYFMNLDGKNIPVSFYKRNYRDIMDFFQNLFKDNYAYGTGLFINSNNSFLFSLCYGGHTYWCVMHGKECMMSTTLTDDICLYNYKIELSELPYFVQKDNSVILALSPYLIMDYAENNLNEEQRNNVFRLLQYSGEDQNPILLKIKM